MYIILHQGHRGCISVAAVVPSFCMHSRRHETVSASIPNSEEARWAPSTGVVSSEQRYSGGSGAYESASRGHLFARAVETASRSSPTRHHGATAPLATVNHAEEKPPAEPTRESSPQLRRRRKISLRLSSIPLPSANRGGRAA